MLHSNFPLIFRFSSSFASLPIQQSLYLHAFISSIFPTFQKLSVLSFSPLNFSLPVFLSFLLQFSKRCLYDYCCRLGAFVVSMFEKKIELLIRPFLASSCLNITRAFIGTYAIRWKVSSGGCQQSHACAFKKRPCIHTYI